LHEVLPEDRNEHRLDAIDFLDDEDLSKSNCKLDVRVELGVLVVQNLNVVVLLL